MAQYYDPREASTTFSLYANIAQTQRQQEEEEKKKKAGTAKGYVATYKFLEGKRAGDIADKQTLMAELDTRTATGRKYKSAEYVAPERKEYDPRRLSDWLNKRYGRSGEERVTREAIVKPSDPTKSEILAAQDLKQRDSQNLETIQNRWDFGKQGNLGSGKGMQLSKDPAIGTIARDELVAKTSKETSDIWKGVAETRGREIRGRESILGQSVPEFQKGRPLMQHKLKAKPVIPGGVISEQIGKPLIPETQYGSFDELVRARNAARGTKGLGVIQEQVNQYMPKGTSYGEASKAFDAAKAATETATAVETGGEVIGSAGETAGGVSPLTVAMEGKQLYDAYTEYGATGGDKVKATAETGADLASSYAIASGNPYAMAAGLIYKGGKFAWERFA